MEGSDAVVPARLRLGPVRLVMVDAAFCAAETQEENKPPLGALLPNVVPDTVLLSSVGVKGAVIEVESLLG